MGYQITQNDINILSQPILNAYIRLSLLNENFVTIDQLSGEIINGSHNIDASSDIRTTCSISFMLKDNTYLIGEDKKIWLNRYAKLELGIYSTRNKIIYWYPLGTFLFNDNNYTYDAQNKTLNVSLVDLMSTLTGIRNGQTKGLSHLVPAESGIRDSIINILSEGGLTFDYRIADIGKTIPYDLEYGTGITVYQMLSDIINLYPGWEMFFDERTFVVQPIPTTANDKVVLESSIFTPLVISENLTNTFSSVKNVSDVWGQCIDADRYADTSTNTDNQYNITLADYTLGVGDKIGFRANIDIAEPTLKINNENTYPIVRLNTSAEDEIPAPLSANLAYVVKFKNSKFYYQGEFQVHGIVKEFNAEPDVTFKAQDKINENCNNIKYVINLDSPYSVEKIGEIRQVLSSGEYDNIYTEDLALQRAEYENWKSTRLQDSINLTTVLIPWLNVNQKVEYTSLITGETNQYIVKSINKNFDSWTMSINMIKFYPLYPFIIE